MDTEKTFKTKTGYCHITPDKIILTRDGIIGNISKVTFGNRISRGLIIYGIISIYFLYSAFNQYLNQQIGMSFVFGCLGIAFIFSIFNSINNSATPVIERNKIQSIKFKNGITGLTRSRFEVLFKNENGKIKKRLIMLPGSLNNGEIETQNALEIMRSENLLSED